MKIKAWIARDLNGSLNLYSDEPGKDIFSWTLWGLDVWVKNLDSTEFSEVKWEDENATEVELEIHLKR